MNAFWFTGVGQALRAFSHLPAPEDSEVAEAFATLRASQGQATGMAFGGTPTDEVDTKRTLDEHGLTLSPTQLHALMQYRDNVEARRRARIHYGMQICVSLVTLLASFAMICLGEPSKDLTIALTGITRRVGDEDIGTV